MKVLGHLVAAVFCGLALDTLILAIHTAIPFDHVWPVCAWAGGLDAAAAFAVLSLVARRPS